MFHHSCARLNLGEVMGERWSTLTRPEDEPEPKSLLLPPSALYRALVNSATAWCLSRPAATTPRPAFCHFRRVLYLRSCGGEGRTIVCQRHHMCVRT